MIKEVTVKKFGLTLPLVHLVPRWWKIPQIKLPRVRIEGLICLKKK